MSDFPWSAKEMTAVHVSFMGVCENILNEHRSGKGGRTQFITGNYAHFDKIVRKLESRR